MRSFVYGYDDICAGDCCSGTRRIDLHVSGRQATSGLATGHAHARCWQPQDKRSTSPTYTAVRGRDITTSGKADREASEPVAHTDPIDPNPQHSSRLRFRIRTPPRHHAHTHTHLLASPALGAGTIRGREDAINNPFQTRVTGCVHARSTVAARATYHQCTVHERHDIRRLFLKLGAAH